MTRKIRGNILLAALIAVLLQLVTVNGYALQSHSAVIKSQNLSGGGASSSNGSGTGLPDLFTGTMSYSVPILVPTGRKGMDPGLALTYRSSNGNGWVGVGWDLDVGAIERSVKNGVDYNNDEDYVLRMAGSTIDLVKIDGAYQEKIVNAFFRIRKLSQGWEVTDKSGTRYIYGQYDATRQYAPADANKIFKWCLDRVEDPNGNYMDITYTKDNGQIYLKQVLYTSNRNTGALPTNQVDFFLEPRADAPDMYTTNFPVKTAYRLKTISVSGNGNPVRAYALTYDADNNTSGLQYSASSGRSLLASIQQFGKDADVDEYGTITATASKLPATVFTWKNDGITGQFSPTGQETGWGWPENARFLAGDTNGDGMTDFMYALPGATGIRLHTATSKGDGSFILSGGQDTGWYWTDNMTVMAGDVNGDGKTDFMFAIPVWADAAANYDHVHLHTAISKGDGTFILTGQETGWGWSDTPACMSGDINGDGKSDFIFIFSANDQARIHTAVSDGDGSYYLSGGQDTGWYWKDSFAQWTVGDVNGDGNSDIMVAFGINGQIRLHTATSKGDSSFILSGGQDTGWGWSDAQRAMTGDVNGDGKTDFMFAIPVWADAVANFDHVHLHTAISKGGGSFALSGQETGWGWANTSAWMSTDINGDGKSDFLFLFPADGVSIITAISTAQGDGTFTLTAQDSSWGWSDSAAFMAGDTNGDGKTDFMYAFPEPYGDVHLHTMTSDAPLDLLNSISNGLGGTTLITYEPSTQYDNTLLPFPVQTVSSVKTNDGNGVLSTTAYTYSNGFFNIIERDFRGFNYVKVTGPGDAIGEQKVAETWFHQGNTASVLSETISQPELITVSNVETGYMKGKPYRTRISDGANNKYSEVTTSYDDSSPYFNPPLQVDAFKCDHGACGMNTKTTFAYDSHGNVANEKHYDGSTLYRTIVRNFTTNVTDWIVGLPLNEALYQGSETGTPVSKTSYYYDGTTSCNNASTNTAPTKGNTTRIVRLYNEKQTGGSDPEVRMAYYDDGNLRCTADAKGNVSTLSYDSTFTYPTVAINPLTHQIKTEYYGVDSIAADNGLYGQVKSITEPNDAKTEMQYDTFGRKIKTTMPDGTWNRWEYSPLDSILTYVKAYDNNGFESWTYFDGLGRTILGKKTGPGGRTISVRTEYNKAGTVKRTSLPYFEGTESPQYTTYAYDPINRTTQVTNPDGKSVFACYYLDATVSIDADKHRKRNTRDVLGRWSTVDEYQGTYDTCWIDATPYATTRYDYDVSANLVKVTDAATPANTTDIQYDSLGRKTYMKDPDMGVWTYEYDANNNLYKQTDAKTQTITFQYDKLNRLTLKDYPTGTDVSYTYDIAPDTEFTTYPKGRLSTMIDASGTTKYYYDNMGRSVATKKTVDDSDYTVRVGYENGRMASITYPDNEQVLYRYGAAGELLSVRTSTDYSYAYYPPTDYTALGQPKTIINGNGVNTIYQYNTQNSRLQNITTSSLNQQLLNLTYDYTDGGNIKSITDPDQPAITVPGESVAYTYGGTRPHFVTSTTDGRIFTPDPNGNTTSDGLRTIEYDYDNMPKSVIKSGVTTTFVYDGAGSRVKKISSDSQTVYIGQLYECTVEPCTKFIFANGKRIAANNNGNIIYYHQDHLGSTRVVTSDTGANQETTYYYPFGAIQSDTGGSWVSHKYTSQEFDAETGLYYYNARYYDPVLGRFISADTIVPNPGNPQALNRYSYVMNNPMRYTDPTGNFAISIGGSFGWYGAQVGYDFKTGHGSIAYSVGASTTVGISEGNKSIGWNVGYNAQVGYNTESSSVYVSGSYNWKIGSDVGVGVSGMYDFRSHNYQVGVGAGYNNYGVNVGYDRYGGYSAGVGYGFGEGGSYGTFGANYNFQSGSWSYSYQLSKTQVNEFRAAVENLYYSVWGNDYLQIASGPMFMRPMPWLGRFLGRFGKSTEMSYEEQLKWSEPAGLEADQFPKQIPKHWYDKLRIPREYQYDHPPEPGHDEHNNHCSPPFCA